MATVPDLEVSVHVAQAEAVYVPLSEIDPNPYQVRLSEDPEAVAKMAASILSMGLLEVPTARRVEGRYQLAFGHTRYAAHTALYAQGTAAYDSMPLVVRELTDRQMFEMAVTENVQRRDLTPIEEAQAMRRALDEFGLTSAQVGELFGVSGETVRGKIRLLALPAKVQDMVQSGEINESVSRALISASKVMRPERMQQTAELIANGAYDIEEAGECIVQNMRGDLLEMSGRFTRAEGDEPRAGYGLWPLTWKHTGLPPMTPAAVVHTLKLKEKPAQIDSLVMALNAGMADYDGVSTVDSETVQKIQVLINPPACTDCPLYVRLNGSHFCGLKACWERKRRTWAQKEFDRLVRELGIPAYANEKTDGEFRRHTWDTRKEFIELVKAKDPDLRLVATPKAQSTDEITGSQFAQVVDVNPKRIKKEAARDGRRAGVSTSITPSVAARMKKEVEERDRRAKLGEASEKFVEQHAVAVFAQAFKPLTNTAVLQTLCKRASEFFGDNPRKAKKATAAELRESLATALLTEEIPGQIVNYSDLEKGPVALAKQLQGVAKEWGVKLPADWMERAEGMMPPAPKSQESTTKDSKGHKAKSKKGKKK